MLSSVQKCTPGAISFAPRCPHAPNLRAPSPGDQHDPLGNPRIDGQVALRDSPHLRDTLMLNGERCPLAEQGDRILAEGDQLYLLSPLAGGRPGTAAAGPRRPSLDSGTWTARAEQRHRAHDLDAR